MKKTTYDNLAIMPAIVGETVAMRKYEQIELSPQLRSPGEAKKVERLRLKMTLEEVGAFGRHCDDKCRGAYNSGAAWFMKIARSKTDAGRDQLYVFASHWLCAWLLKPKKKWSRVVIAALCSSHGKLTFNTETGRVLVCSLERSFGAKPVRVDVDEWRRRYPGEDMDGEHDVLDFGYWLRNGKYEAPCEDWRVERETMIAKGEL